MNQRDTINKYYYSVKTGKNKYKNVIKNHLFYVIFMESN